LDLDRMRIEASSFMLDVAYEVGEAGTVTATTAVPLAPGQYVLHIEFSNDYDRQATSFYKVESGGDAYTFTDFEAAFARQAFPCWDEPSFKHPYQVTLIVPADHAAISNTPVVRESESESVDEQTGAPVRFRAFEFAEAKPLPSYLVAFATGPFDSIPIDGLSIPASIVTVRGRTDLTGLAREMTPPLVEALETYFNSPYPFDKLDFVSVPEYLWGAMENPGAITFSDVRILLDPEAASFAQRRWLASTIAHEVAHMWFGNLVTLAWWDDLWLNESFAQWMENKITQAVHPEFNYGITSLVDAQEAMVVAPTGVDTAAVFDRPRPTARFRLS
jgi:alanyl aminopeptidase